MQQGWFRKARNIPILRLGPLGNHVLREYLHLIENSCTWVSPSCNIQRLCIIKCFQFASSFQNDKYAHAGIRTRVTSMGGLYDTATLRALAADFQTCNRDVCWLVNLNMMHNGHSVPIRNETSNLRELASTSNIEPIAANCRIAF
jgi:hypothetical protein